MSSNQEEGNQIPETPHLSEEVGTPPPPPQDDPETPPPKAALDWEPTGYTTWECVRPQISVLLKGPLKSHLAYSTRTVQVQSAKSEQTRAHMPGP